MVEAVFVVCFATSFSIYLPHQAELSSRRYLFCLSPYYVFSYEKFSNKIREKSIKNITVCPSSRFHYQVFATFNSSLFLSLSPFSVKIILYYGKIYTNIKFTILIILSVRCNQQSEVVYLPSLSISRTLSSSQTETPQYHKITLHFPLPAAPGNLYSTFYLYEFTYSRQLM